MLAAICLQRNALSYLNRLSKLPPILYNKCSITYKSIDSFIVADRKLNDRNNKMRESIIGAIINDVIPASYYKMSMRWRRMRASLTQYILTINTRVNVKLTHKGGRNNHYDFTISVNGKQYNIEFKFNIDTISNSPQFVSPMRPSKYMGKSYEEFFYDVYLGKLATMANLPMPDRDTYLSEIHSTDPSCMRQYKQLYYNGCKQSSKYTKRAGDIEFYNYAKKLDCESRVKFIANTELHIGILSEYLQKTQSGKIYMLYKDGTFHKELVDMAEYNIVGYTKQPLKYRYVANTATGKKINILLRWKNGNGIAYPAFQIS